MFAAEKTAVYLCPRFFFYIFFKVIHEVSGPPRSTIYRKILQYHGFGIRDRIQLNWDHFQIYKCINL